MILYRDKLKSIRKRKKTTAQELADKLGITRTTLSSWENGRILPSENKVRMLAKVLEIPVDEISDLKVEKPISESALAPLVSGISSFLSGTEGKTPSDAQNICSNIMNMSKKIADAKLIIEAIFSSLPIIFYIKAPDLSYINANKAFLDSLSLNKNYDVRGKKDSDFFPVNDAKVNSEMDREVIKTGKSLLNTEGHIPGSRKSKWCLISKIPIIDSKGNFEGLISYFVDITEKKNTEKELNNYRDHLEELVDEQNKELKKNSKRFNDIFYNSPLNSVIYRLVRNQKGEITDWIFSEINDLGARSIGRTATELIGKKATELFGKKVLKPYLELCRKVVADGKPKTFETYFEYNDKYYLSSVFPIDSDFYANITKDISDSKKCESKLRTFFDMPFQGITFSSPDKKLIEVNKKFCTMLGYTKEELQSLTWSELTHPEDLSKDLEQFEKVLSGHIDMYSMEKRFIRKNKEIIRVNLSVGCIRRPDRSVEYFVGLLQDITENKKAQKEKEEAEAELKKNQTLLTETEDIGKVGGWNVNIDTNELTWTEGVYKIHETDQLFVPTIEKAVNFYTKSSKPIIQKALKQALEHSKPFNIELEILTAKGNLKIVNAVGKIDLNNRRIYGFLQDITERKKTEVRP